MDSCQYDFFISAFCQLFYFPNHIFSFPASHPSSCIGNNTVGAKLIASILYFDICAGMFSRMGQMKLLILRSMTNIYNFFLNSSLPASLFPLLPIVFQDSGKLLLFVVTDHDIDPFLQLISPRLHIAACRNNNRIGIHFSCPVNHLSGFPVCHIGYCTGINNIDVGFIMKGNDLITALFQNLLHRFCFICVYFASQIVKCCLFH